MEVARIWRQRKQRYNLEGVTCNHCGAPQFLARPVCQQCGGLIGHAAPAMLQDENRMSIGIRINEKTAVPQSRG